MFEFTDAERAFQLEMRGLTTDAQGREVLVGLTYEETVFYMNYVRARIRNQDDPEHAERYLELDDKYNFARLQVIGAEAERRNEDPTQH